MLEIFDRSLDLFMLGQKSKCDILICPVKEKITSLELDKSERLLKLGEEAALLAIPAIKKALYWI